MLLTNRSTCKKRAVYRGRTS